MCPVYLAAIVAATATSGGGLGALARVAKEENIGMKKNSKTEKHKVGAREEWLAALFGRVGYAAFITWSNGRTGIRKGAQEMFRPVLRGFRPPARKARQRPGLRGGVDRATFVREWRGMSAFVLEDGVIYHTYSTYARGVDALWGMWRWLDRTPKGRNGDADDVATIGTKSSELITRATMGKIMAREHWTWLRVPHQLNGAYLDRNLGGPPCAPTPVLFPGHRLPTAHNSCGLVRLTRSLAVTALF